MAEADVRSVVEGLFRRKSGELTATLTRVFGPARLDLAEGVVQDALLRALQVWPYQGIPENPEGWLHRVARNLALDAVRHEAMTRDKEAAVTHAFEAYLETSAAAAPDQLVIASTSAAASPVSDDVVRMLFICCHPILPQNVQVALALKTVFGLGVTEIARLYFAKEATISQRLVRAKQKIADAGLAFELPDAAALEERAGGVLETLYGLFSEGYNALGSEELLRADLCHEALRLARLVATHPQTGLPPAHALAASMAFAAARFAQRVSPQGELLLLEDQDRAQWSAELISVGFFHLERAAEGDELSTYHVEAGIAACHASAPTYEATDWARIVALYDLLQRMAPSPVTALNRAVAVAMAKGPEAGLKALAPLQKAEALAGSHLVVGVQAALLEKLGRRGEALALYRKALGRAPSPPERAFLHKRIARLGEA